MVTSREQAGTRAGMEAVGPCFLSILLDFSEVLIALRSEVEFLSVEWPTSLVDKGWFGALERHSSLTYPLAWDS